MDVMEARDLVRFEFNVDFGRISYTVKPVYNDHLYNKIYCL